MSDLDKEFNITGPKEAREPVQKMPDNPVRYDADGQRAVIDHNYRGCDPFNRDIFTFKDPRNRKKARMPNNGMARLDPSDDHFGID